MVKDIPIPKEIFTEFQPFVKDKESLAKLFDNLDCCVLCDDKRKEEDMPSQTKGQNCLDRYFVKINSQKNSSTCESEMGKKSTNNNSVHNVSSSSDSDTKETNLKSVSTKNHMAIELDANSEEAFQIEPTPSKPIIAAMNALGKLKQDIAKVTVDDNSSRDSTALVIDEEQLEPEKDPSPDIEETPQIKATSRKSNDNVQSSKLSKDKCSSSNNKPPVVNESLNFSNLFNSSKIATSSQIGRFSTSTPVEDDKSGKRKRTDDDESFDQPSSKKTKEKNVKFDKEPWLESMRESDDMIEVKSFNDGDCPFFMEDLESDDELYVVQCPKEVNLENLVGKNLELNGETRFKLEVNGTNQLYECFAEKDTMGRHVNMILPSRKEEKFKFGVYQLNGSLVISESLDDPDETSSDQGEMKITVNQPCFDSKKELQTKKLHEPKERSSEKVKKHKKKRDNSDIEQSSEEVIKACSKERRMSDPEIKSSELVGSDTIKNNSSDPSNELNESREKTTEKVKKRKKKRDNTVTVKEEIPLKDELEENVSPVKKKKKRKETSEEKVTESTEQTSHSDADHEKVENKKKRVKDSEFSSEGVTSVKEEKKIKKEKKEKTEENQVDQECLKMEIDEEIVTKKKKKKKHHDEAENIEPLTEMKQLPVEILKLEVLEAQDSNSDGTVKKKKKKKDKDIKVASVEAVAETDEPVVTEETVIKKKKKKKHHDQVSGEPVIDLDAEEENVAKVDEGDSRNHFILSSFVESDEVSSKKKKKKKKKKEKEKTDDH